jgi:hypothetical protein
MPASATTQCSTLRPTDHGVSTDVFYGAKAAQRTVSLAVKANDLKFFTKPRSFHNPPIREFTMSFTKNVLTAVLAVSLFSLAGCVSTATKEGTGAYVEDSVITGKVKAVILNEPMLKSREINVETFKGVVQLSGFISSEAEAMKAVEVTRGVKGVMSVKNDMRIK